MGFPAKSLSDIVKYYYDIETQLKPNYYVFPLYSSDNIDFRKYILDNFNSIHQKSNHVVFFLFDSPPKNWKQENDLNYYENIVGKNYDTDFNEDEIRTICNYINISDQNLPVLISFNSLQSNSFNIFNFKNVPIEIVDHFISDIIRPNFSNEVERNQYGRNDLLYYEQMNRLRRRNLNISQHISYISSIDNNMLSLIKKILNELNNLSSDLRRVESKIDRIEESINSLSKEFNNYKIIRKEDEEKITFLNGFLDKKLTEIMKVENDKIENYINQIKIWLEDWEKLEKLNMTFLPSAEYLYDRLSILKSSSEVDFSPFILQYCRTIETELLKKIFSDYTVIVKKRIRNFDEIIKTESKINELNKFISKLKKGNTEYTLGEMNFIFKITNKHKNNNAIITDFIKYLNERFEAGYLINNSFTSQINKITSDYRNKSAHPSILNLDIAEHCKLETRSLLNEILTNFKE